MAQAYFSLVTAAGRIKLAASASGGPQVTITHFAIGDGNGAESNPTSASTALVHEVWRTGVESVIIDPDNPSAVLVSAIIPTAIGGWWMREFGIFDAAGTMIAVAKPVSQYKPTAIEGQLEDIRYEFQIIIGEAANVTLLVDPSVLLATREWVTSRKITMSQLHVAPFVPVLSFTTNAPPASPPVGALYAVPNAATGTWAGHGQKLAEWTGSAWALIATPNGHVIGTPDGNLHRKLAGNYTKFDPTVFATTEEHLAGDRSDRMTHPAGVKAVIGAGLSALRADLIDYINGLLVVTGDVAATFGQFLWCDTTAGPITVTLPSELEGDEAVNMAPIAIMRWGPNPVIVARGTETIAGLAENLTIDRDKRGVAARFVPPTYRLEPMRVA